MSEPIRISCKSKRDIPSVDEIQELADSKHHVVLEFPFRWWLPINKKHIIEHLAMALTDYSVFDSGGGPRTTCVTVTAVVSQERVLNSIDKILDAIDCYIVTCSNLTTEYEEGILNSEWSAMMHGEHVRLENSNTGQIVEAPLMTTTIETIDPYFFGVFVKTTENFVEVAQLITDEYHDSRRILEIIRNHKRQQ